MCENRGNSLNFLISISNSHERVLSPFVLVMSIDSIRFDSYISYAAAMESTESYPPEELTNRSPEPSEDGIPDPICSF